MTTYAVEVTTTTRPNDTRTRETRTTELTAVAVAKSWVGPDTPLVTIARFADDSLSFRSVTWHPYRGVNVTAWRTNIHDPLVLHRPAAVA